MTSLSVLSVTPPSHPPCWTSHFWAAGELKSQSRHILGEHKFQSRHIAGEHKSQSRHIAGEDKSQSGNVAGEHKFYSRHTPKYLNITNSDI